MSLPSTSRSRHGTLSFPQGENAIGKHELRRTLLRTRRELNDETRAQWDAAIGKRLHEMVRERNFKSLGVFWPIRNEPDLRGLYGTLSQEGVRLALPLVVGREAPLQFAAWKPGDEMTADALGVLVPQDKQIVPMPEAILAPCVGFNATRYRLGYGGGFFDRTLAEGPRPYAIGIAYAFQEVVLPVGEYDIALDCIITEKTVLR